MKWKVSEYWWLYLMWIGMIMTAAIMAHVCFGRRIF